MSIIGKFTLAILYTSSDFYQNLIIDDYGIVLKPDDLFWTPDAAEQEGRESISLVSTLIAIGLTGSSLKL